jgi:predicted DNA-binding transcriptional regulator AlpA
MSKTDTPAHPSRLLTETDVARYLNVSTAAVRRWRYENRGPEYLKIGASVRYRPASVDMWLDSRVASTSGLEDCSDAA